MLFSFKRPITNKVIGLFNFTGAYMTYLPVRVIDTHVTDQTVNTRKGSFRICRQEALICFDYKYLDIWQPISINLNQSSTTPNPLNEGYYSRIIKLAVGKYDITIPAFSPVLIVFIGDKLPSTYDEFITMSETLYKSQSFHPSIEQVKDLSQFSSNDSEVQEAQYDSPKGGLNGRGDEDGSLYSKVRSRLTGSRV